MKLDFDKILLRTTGVTVQTVKHVYDISQKHVKLIGDYTFSKFPKSLVVLFKKRQVITDRIFCCCCF